jgi:hypothetical protein
MEGESTHFERESAGATLHRRFENLTDSRKTGKLIKLGQIVWFVGVVKG